MTGFPLAPGATIGIVGGGQLGRMLAMAAARFGYKVAVLDPDPACPAAQVASRLIVGPYGDEALLAQLAAISDVVTFEFENVAVEPLRKAMGGTELSPPAEALEVSQDRVVEKAFLNGIGVATAEWRAIDAADELGHALLDLGGDCILKTRRFGYDGKGQARINAETTFTDAFEEIGRAPAILEKRVPFAFELSIIAARGRDGAIAAYDPAENVHTLGILKSSTVPGRITPDIAAEAQGVAARILTHLNYVGVIGVEFFVGRDSALLVNEMAPRVHNSGHWTEAACLASQFENHVRAIAGLPLASPERHFDCVMENLIGDDVGRFDQLVAEPRSILHLYGKAETRRGRKMGHITRVTPRTDGA
ncbi:5-(carboxyamino)imidazole ribonucleotide synthase [Aurantimonas sp. 22II-16-19i]|uniref:5-(carboxyamino)imidazole ribonucleotide synthase n=1 Tax=Aurantimonas sp. 22II-16-19i TaxID=1317114 RepID=UPI0009F7CA71|nr:5-(carboxyamino)imidazole ribonucleotide synthase [Aurantimonas sp. 22II-16-19i]ORE98235.1 phosphoribosylaminoimidazole carboxylase ATPase subunit [Aurantimonas sp. 22II-16-19i]